MIEFAAGAAVATYALVLGYVVREDRPRGVVVIAYLLWPLVLALSPLANWLYKRWKYERREPGLWGHPGLYLRADRSPNDGWREMIAWAWDRARGRPRRPRGTTRPR